MRVDVPRLDATIEKVGERVAVLTERLKQDEVWGIWKRRHGSKASLGSRQQLGQVLYKELGYKSTGATRSGRIQVDEKALSQIDLPFVKTYLEVERLKKLRSTYLIGVRREVVDGFLHPVFNLHFARTYRSSCDSPNFQNIPIRDKQIGKLVRRCFVPREGHVLVEIDYGALEVRIAACYHKDPNMLEYIEDPSKDLHREMASECYMVGEDQVSKEMRFYAKNQFVFPEFYGSYYAQCAPNLWEAVDRFGLRLADGRSLREHLDEIGMLELGACSGGQPAVHTFESHVQEVEADFWGRRFPVYARWKKNWWEQYQRNGDFRMLTGFRVDGVYKRNDVINYPVQGAAFHCLLWSLIKLVKWLARSKMRTVIVGQIHDSIVADVHRSELGDYLAKAKRVMTEEIRKAWRWIIVPLVVEAEVGEENWWEKKEVEV